MPLDDTKDVILPPNSRVIQPIFLEKHSNKKDLIRRLRKVVEVLQNEESIEPGHPEWPGLAATADCLVQHFLHHRDKEVRLHAVLACMELFAIYAPEVPWEEEEILPIFRQTVSQLGNLSHTTDPSAANFREYVRILDLLAQVKIGVVLVELAKNEYQDEQGSALECLTELIHTLLYEAVHKDHPTEIFELVQQSICACIDEYNPDQGLSVPIPFLDELLLCLEQGPTVTALVATEAGKPPKQVEQPNATYQTAAAVLRRMQNKLTSGISQLLNALLNGDAEKEQSGITNVHAVVFELHRVAPSINTTILGTVQSQLSSADTETRALVVQLLGRIFVRDREARQNYGPLFRAWLGRHRDMSIPIRQSILSSCVLLLPETSNTVQELLEDPCTDIRLQAIHKVSDAIYSKQLDPPPEPLLRAMAKRVSSKHAAERKDAVTGLAKIYFRLFMQPVLKDVSGDDVDLSVLQKILSGADQPANDSLGWIPTTVFESLCFSDSVDTEMRSRVIQIIDDVLLGSDLSKSKKLSATARAVGLTLTLESIGVNETEESNAFKFLQQFLRQRAALQKAVTQYIDARSEIRQYERGTEPALAADARAMEYLHQVATLSSAPDKVIEAFHSAKDRHIFRILATIAHPNHSSKSRVRALDELPKRTQSLGDNVAQWVKQLAHRCAMSDFMNQDVITQCVALALELFRADDVSSCSILLTSVQLASSVFPALCGGATFETLSELFLECRECAAKELRKELNQTGVVTRLSSILAVAVAHRSKKDNKTEKSTTKELELQLHRMCTREGNPEQSRNAVYTLARLGGNDSDQLDSITKTLISPSRLTLNPGKDESRLLSVLAALSALADCSPTLFVTNARGEKAIAFALEKIILGRSGDSASSEGDDVSVEDSSASVKSNVSRRSSAKKHRETHLSPTANTNNVLENGTLSLACRRICGAINFLVSFLRSNILRDPKSSKSFIQSHTQMITTIFSTLSQMVRDDGLPPSTRDRKLCRFRQDRAALRQFAAIHLLRLCDPRLHLEKQFLSPCKWHILSDIFLDDEKVVREAAMEELSNLLTGSGFYGVEGSHLPPKAPALRFLAYTTLCIDGDHGLNHSIANANAANVGKASSVVKSAALQCVTSLRKTCESTYLQCRAMGPAAEQRFENQLKMLLMPEYTVPFAFHLLSHRKETPSYDVQEKDDGDGLVLGEGEEGHHRILRKRLKMLYEPLVQSLGDSADNISFLLRMVENVGKQFSPVDVSFERTGARLSIGSDRSNIVEANPGAQAGSRQQLERLRTVALVSREILLSFVKKDVNLSAYPGAILLPKTLFKQQIGAPITAVLSRQSKESSTHNASLSRVRTPPTRRSPKFNFSVRNLSHESNDTYNRTRSGITPARRSSILNLSNGKETPESNESNKRSRVHFSPEVDASEASKRRKMSKFGGISPIAKSASPASIEPSSASRRHEDKSIATLGSTPPSALRTSTLRSTAGDGETDQESPPSKNSKDIGSSKVVNQSSSVVMSEVRKARHTKQGEDLDEGIKTTSETQSTEHTSRDARLARGRRTVTRQVAPTKNGIPSLISVNRPKPKKQSKRKKNQLDFDSDDELERENKQNGKAKNKTGNNKTSSKATVGARRVLRSRMG